MKTTLLIAVLACLSWSKSISISLDKSKYLLGEPAYLEISSDLEIPLSLEEDVVKLRIVQPDGKVIVYKPPMMLCRSLNPDKPPSTSYSTLITSKGEFVFPSAGEYILSVSYGDEDGAIASAPLKITITVPSTASDKAAFSEIMTNPNEYGLVVYLQGGDHIKQGMKIINKLTESKSSYETIACFVTSVNYSRNHYDYEAKNLRFSDIDKALKYFEKYRTRANKYMLLENAAYLSRSINNHNQEGRNFSIESKRAVNDLDREIQGYAYGKESNISRKFSGEYSKMNAR